MRLEVRLHGFGEPQRSVALEPEATYADVLAALDIPSESVLVFSNEQPVPVDDPVDRTATVRVVRIVSGG